MPADVFQFIAPNVPDFSRVLIIGPIRDERPFAKDLAHVVSTEPSSCDRLHYCAPARGTPHPTRAGFIFIGDFDHATEEIGDTYTFNRRWANVPSSRIDFVGSYAFPFPGLPNGTSGSAKTITALSPADGTESVLNNPVLTATAHGFAVGQLVRYSLTYTGGTVSPKTIGGTSRVGAVIDANNFTLLSILQFLGPDGSYNVGTFSTGTAVAFAAARGPKLLVSSARDVVTYALPGVTPGITTPEDFRAEPKFQPILTSTTEEVDTLSAGTSPTDTAYRAAVDAGDTLVAESKVEEYLGGPILQRVTTVVTAL